MFERKVKKPSDPAPVKPSSPAHRRRSRFTTLGPPPLGSAATEPLETEANQAADRITGMAGPASLRSLPSGGGAGARGLPLPIRSLFESRWGYDFSRVQVHTDSAAAESALAMNARAYTLGPDISFAPGYYDTSSPRGMHLLAHEMSHVVQQGYASPLNALNAQGAIPQVPVRQRVAPQIQMSPLGPENEKLDAFAFVNGDKAWSDAEKQKMKGLLAKLDETELATIEGYKFVRWSSRAERLLKDTSYVETPKDEQSAGDHAARHEWNILTGRQQVTVYDEAFAENKFVVLGNRELPAYTQTIFHEIGHALQVAEYRFARKAYDGAFAKEGKALAAYNADPAAAKKKQYEQAAAASDKFEKQSKQLSGSSLAELKKIAQGQELSSGAQFDAIEYFAEAFGYYKLDPVDFERTRPAVYKWFQRHGYLNSDKAKG